MLGDVITIAQPGFCTRFDAPFDARPCWGHNGPMPERVLIVGGVAGGASCAARLRRLNESAEIALFDRGPYVSFANCGLPYFVGNVIAEEGKLLVASSALFRNRFNIAVHTHHDVLAIDRTRQTIRVRDLEVNAERDEHYDTLVLAPGAAPIRPSMPGIDLPGIFAVRTIPDSRRIRGWLDERKPERALVIGGGFIGLEMAENLARRGLAVTVLEKLPQVMPPLDAEMAVAVAEHLRAKGVTLALGDGLTGFEPQGHEIVARAESGARHSAGLVVLAIGVRPESGLAIAAGLPLGPRGGIAVDRQMRTPDPRIFAVGDAVEVTDVVTGQETVLPLAGPANRQGRVAADAIAGRDVSFRGVQATAVVGVFGLTVASTGASEKGLQRAGVGGFAKIYLHPGHHAGYYPGAKAIQLKLLFDVATGRVLGAQATGLEGVEKRIDVVATVIQMGGTVRDLAEAELCYAPQFGAAKDPVNLAGMIATNYLDGDMPLADWSRLSDWQVIDVREADEFAAGHVPGALNLPLSVMRERWEELPRDRPLALCCGVGQRAYYGVRFLRQHGLEAANLSGGYTTYRSLAVAGLVGT
jgi:NADPH-dependent 2,4-dienoyl-CoA reductase/sulfur reductase-like enzyme/rhodanese-related sulfurtransferase